MTSLSGWSASRGPRRLFPLLMGACALAQLLAGCQGTGFGEGLTRSFSLSPPSPPQGSVPATPERPSPATSPTAPARTPPAGGPADGTDTKAAGNQSSGDQRGPGNASEAATAPKGAAPSGTATAAAPGGKPTPYRLILRLPLADPSAPAEVVTRALRAAGVPFEVETIERMPEAGSRSEGSTPATGSTPPASSRPAPEPAP